MMGAPVLGLQADTWHRTRRAPIVDENGGKYPGGISPSALKISERSEGIDLGRFPNPIDRHVLVGTVSSGQQAGPKCRHGGDPGDELKMRSVGGAGKSVERWREMENSIGRPLQRFYCRLIGGNLGSRHEDLEH